MQVASAGPIFVDRSKTFGAVMSEIWLFPECGIHFVESRPPVSARSWSERRDIDESNINLTAMRRLVHVGMRRVSGMSVFRAAFVVKVLFFVSV